MQTEGEEPHDFEERKAAWEAQAAERKAAERREEEEKERAEKARPENTFFLDIGAELGACTAEIKANFGWKAISAEAHPLRRRQMPHFGPRTGNLVPAF